MPPWTHRRVEGDASLVRLPDAAGRARWLWAGPAEAAESLLAALPALPLAEWDWLEVRSGIAPVQAATVEAFVPQMLNYELVGGVNFQKGCYPGQEVVARSQYRGTLKRRAFLLGAQGAAQPGQELFHVVAGVAVGQLEHRVVQAVEAGQRDELELVAHGGMPCVDCAR